MRVIPRTLERITAFLVVFLLFGCHGSGRPVQMGGGIFGTTWSLTYLSAPEKVTPEIVKEEVETVFALVNASMNHYDPESLISRFNGLSMGVPLKVDGDFAHVLSKALELGELTDGVYDVTLSPLSQLWGFGPQGSTRIPTAEQIGMVRREIGSAQLIWEPSSRMLEKRIDELKLDFSSLAKGYAVDLVAETLDELEVQSYMFEIGGEIRVRGLSPRGDSWRIGVKWPEQQNIGRLSREALEVTDIAVATSGDYLNFFEWEDNKYSHLIDPRTGYPIQNDVVSVTVVHGSAMMADAWATALTVMGSRAAMNLAVEHHLAVYLMVRNGGILETQVSPKMRVWLSNNVSEKEMKN